MIDDLVSLFEDDPETGERQARRRKPRDSEWASFQADKLLASADFVMMAGSTPDRGELIMLLLKLDQEFLQEKSDISWAQYSAGRIIDIFS